MACIIQITHFLCKVKFEYNQKKFKVACLKFTHQGIQVHLTFLPLQSVPLIMPAPAEKHLSRRQNHSLRKFKL